jgi:hypothetical protein
MSEKEVVKDEKSPPPLTDEEKVVLEAASDVNSTVGDDLEARQRHYNRMSEFYPNIKKELREALNLPLKMYGGGSVRMTRSY